MLPRRSSNCRSCCGAPGCSGRRGEPDRIERGRGVVAVELVAVELVAVELVAVELVVELVKIPDRRRSRSGVTVWLQLAVQPPPDVACFRNVRPRRMRPATPIVWTATSRASSFCDSSYKAACARAQPRYGGLGAARRGAWRGAEVVRATHLGLFQNSLFCVDGFRARRGRRWCSTRELMWRWLQMVVSGACCRLDDSRRVLMLETRLARRWRGRKLGV